jgi:hypothetical protein
VIVIPPAVAMVEQRHDRAAWFGDDRWRERFLRAESQQRLGASRERRYQLVRPVGVQRDGRVMVVACHATERILRVVPKPPIGREELDAELWEYLHRDPKERAAMRRDLQEWMTKILAELARFDAKHQANFDKLDTRLTGVEARTRALEEATPRAIRVAPKVDPVSLPPPPSGLGNVSDSGIHRFTEHEMAEWQRAYQAQRDKEDAQLFKAQEKERRQDQRKLRSAVIIAAVLAFLGTFSSMMIREMGMRHAQAVPHEAQK